MPTERRHPNVVNRDEIEPNKLDKGKHKTTMVDADNALPGRDTRPFSVPNQHYVLGTPLEPPFPEGYERGPAQPTAITPESEDPVGYAQDLQRERCVLFVACTRARDHLSVSGTGHFTNSVP